MKKIAYITGSRAEYGIMKRLLKKIDENKDIDLSIIATGMHTDKKYGETYKVIEKDGFKIEKLIDIEINTQNNSKILNSMSICQKKFGEYFQNNKFDAIMILGDRYEIFSVAIAAAIQNIPIIHLHGGEKTLGNYDEFIRHAITKMSKLHLASTEEYKNRIIQMGENPKNVFNIGALGAENSFKLNLLNKEELVDRFGKIAKEYFVVVFHPETITGVSLREQVMNVLNSLDNFKDKYEFIFIGSNSDTGSELIVELVKEYCNKNKFKYLISVRPEEYLSLIKFSKGLIGNSSSGLIEVPSFKIPTINIGDRQKGRVRGETVIDVIASTEEITQAIERAVSFKFLKQLENTENPYFRKNVVEEAYEIILQFLNSDRVHEIKEFYDIQ